MPNPFGCSLARPLSALPRSFQQARNRELVLQVCIRKRMQMGDGVHAGRANGTARDFPMLFALLSAFRPIRNSLVLQYRCFGS